MPKYIDAEKIQFTGKTVYDPDYGDTLISVEDVRKAIAQVPMADVQEVKHGMWITDGDITIRRTQCSVCRHEYAVQKGMLQLQIFNYCPNCGARMDGE